jgi:uncharacterized membrane protein YphA (DoxX/SURF4 family)
MSTTPTPTEAAIYQPLRLTYGLIPLLAGLDKYLNILADWPSYVSPMVSGVLPLSPEALMQVVGVVEIAVGILVLTRWTRLGAWIAAAWLTLIAVNLVSMGILDVAVRDLAMAVGAYTLARLAEARELAPTRARAAATA